MTTSSSSSSSNLTDLKIDLADGCDTILETLRKQLDSENCQTIVRVDVGYLHSHPIGRPPTPTTRAADAFSRLSDDELLLVFQGIVCCLPNIKTLVIMSYFRSDALSLPVTALEMIFRRAIRLEILFLHQIRLHGTAHEFNHVLPKSLQRHPSLKRVNLHCCGGAYTVVQEEPASSPVHLLDALVCALAKLPTLYYLSLDQAPMSRVAFQALAQSESLKDLSFYNMPEIKLSLDILLEALQIRSTSTCQLHGLRIRSCNLTGVEASRIASMMETNTSLESLVFYCNSWNDYGPSLGKSLERNTTLKRLEVGVGKGTMFQEPQNASTEETTSTAATSDADIQDMHEKAAKCISKALEANVNSSLRHACLCLSNGTGDQLYKAYMKPFEQMLESNYTMESFLLQAKDSFSVVSPKATFLMKLNQRSVLDRRRLFRGLSTRKGLPNSTSKNADTQGVVDPWMQSLIQHRDDLSIVFYLLSRNPGLVTTNQSLS